MSSPRALSVSHNDPEKDERALPLADDAAMREGHALVVLDVGAHEEQLDQGEQDQPQEAMWIWSSDMRPPTSREHRTKKQLAEDQGLAANHFGSGWGCSLAQSPDETPQEATLNQGPWCALDPANRAYRSTFKDVRHRDHCRPSGRVRLR